MSEHSIQDDVRVALSKYGYFVIRTAAGNVEMARGGYFNPGMPNGWPDLTGINLIDHTIFLIEMKSPTGKPRDDQIRLHKFFKKHGICHGIARSPEDAIKIVQGQLCGYGFEKYDKEE
ncbi:MAG: VRR-NUC domain-containing protein [Oenococcus oeni]